MFKFSKKARYAGRPAFHQRGSALIVALVFLLAMTLIGTTAMQGTTQQERMAGNYWDRNLAFQAAEAALSVGGRDVLSRAASNLPSIGAAAVTPWDQDASWWNANSTEGPSYQGLSSRPRYTIRNRGASSGGGVEFAAATGFICQVVARATGGSDNALVILAEDRECG